MKSQRRFVIAAMMIVLLSISASPFAATYRQHNESFTFTRYREASNTTA